MSYNFNYKRLYRHKDQYNYRMHLLDYTGTANHVYAKDITAELKEAIYQHYISFTLEERYKVKFIIQHGLESDPVIIKDDWIFAVLHDIVDSIQDLTPKQITFETGNWNINKVYYQWHQQNIPDKDKINIAGVFELIKLYSPKIWDYQNKAGVNVGIDYRTDFTPKVKPYVFTTLNRAPHRHRMELFLKLKEYNLLEKGMCSFNEARPDALSRDLTQEELAMLPITLDVDLDKSSPFDHIYGETMPQAFSYMEQKDYDKVPNKFLNFFENSYFTIVTETKIGIPSVDDIYCNEHDCKGICWPTSDWHRNKSNKTGLECIRCHTVKSKPKWMEIYDEKFITEKTWRNMLNGHPMIWIGTRHTAKMLKHLGFKTFDSLWDESYDEIRDPLVRFNAVTSLVNELCKKTDEEWLEIQEKAIPILKHNQNKMRELDEVLRVTDETTHNGELVWKTS
jgi:hypothetical protein